jgi:hypothetical protein
LLFIYAYITMMSKHTLCVTPKYWRRGNKISGSWTFG